MRENWTYKKLGEVGVVVTGSTPSTKDEANYDSPDYCFVKPSDLPSKGIAVIDESEFHISSKAFSSARQLPKGSVVVSCIGIIGKVGILNKDACTNQQINAIIPNDTILPKCLAYIICNNKRELEQIANAPIVPIINKSEFSKFSIPVPPLSEQQSIVAELDKINELISLKKVQLSDLDALAQSIFYDMFGDPIENEKGWEVKKLQEVCLKITDGTHNSPVNTDKGDYMYVTAKNIKKDGIITDNITYVSADIHKIIYERCNPKYGDVLYIKDGVTTGIATINTLKEEFSLLSSVALLKPNNNVISHYLKAVLNFPSLYASIRKNMGGAAITRLTIVKIKTIKIPLPPLSLQQDFAKRIELIEQQKAQISSTIKDLETLLASRMQYWFD